MKNPFRRQSVQLERSNQPTLNFNAYLELMNSFSYGGARYFYPSTPQTDIGWSYGSLASSAYKSNGVIFACMLVRQLLFSEARFQFQALNGGRPGDLFGSNSLEILEHPWPGATTGDLLTKMIQYADLAGNAYAVRMNDQIRVLRPDWVKIVVGTDQPDNDGYDTELWDPDAVIVGYIYKPGGPGSDSDPYTFRADEVAHFAPIPDPECQFRGMSWITPVVREIMWDKAATDFKLSFFENAATPQLAVKLDVPDVEQMREWIDLFKNEHEGLAGAHKTMYLGAGADVTPLGHSFEQIQLKQTQGAGETRIAAAAGVPPVIVGLSEGLDAATYSNYSQARRRLVDGTVRPLWRNIAGSLERIVPPPRGQSRLWYDDRDIPFLRDDLKDVAAIQSEQAAAMSSLVAAGFDPDSVVKAISSADMTLLSHTGLVSVQLLPPGQAQDPPPGQKAPPPDAQNSGRDLASEMLMLAGYRAIERAAAMRGEPIVIQNHVAPAETRLELPITVDAPRVELPINVTSPDVRVETPVNVEAARVEVPVHVDAPRVEVPVNVEAPRVEVPVTVESPEVRVDAPVTVEPARVEVPVTVENPPISVTVEAPPPTEVNVQLAQEKPRTKTVEFSDGRTATVRTEEGTSRTKTVEFSDGRVAIVKEETDE